MESYLIRQVGTFVPITVIYYARDQCAQDGSLHCIWFTWRSHLMADRVTSWNHVTTARFTAAGSASSTKCILTHPSLPLQSLNFSETKFWISKLISQNGFLPRPCPAHYCPARQGGAFLTHCVFRWCLASFSPPHFWLHDFCALTIVRSGEQRDPTAQHTYTRATFHHCSVVYFWSYVPLADVLDSCLSTLSWTTWRDRPPSPRSMSSWVWSVSTSSLSSSTSLASSLSTLPVSSFLVTTPSRPCSPRVPRMTLR